MPRGRQSTLTPDRVAAVHAHRRRGAPQEEIARLLGMGNGTVQRALAMTPDEALVAPLMPSVSKGQALEPDSDPIGEPDEAPIGATPAEMLISLQRKLETVITAAVDPGDVLAATRAAPGLAKAIAMLSPPPPPDPDSHPDMIKAAAEARALILARVERATAP